MPLIVDSREKAVIRQYLWRNGIKGYKVEALKTGDYLFYDKSRDDRILVERKTVSDLVSSHKSGRLKKQMKRMSEEANAVLLITGDISEVERYSKVEPNFVSQVMSDAVVRYGFKSVIWLVGHGRDTHEKGLVFAGKMFKNMELGLLGKKDNPIEKKARKGRCKECGKKLIKIEFDGKVAYVCEQGCKYDNL